MNFLVNLIAFFFSKNQSTNFALKRQ